MTYQMSINVYDIKYFHEGNTFEVIVIECSLPDIPKLFYSMQIVKDYGTSNRK